MLQVLKTLLVFYLCLLPCCKSQSFKVVVYNRHDNTLTLECRNQDTTEKLTTPVFYLNNTQENLRERLGTDFVFDERSNNAIFEITRALEGNYFCAPQGLSVIQLSPTLLVGEPLALIIQFYSGYRYTSGMH